MSRSLHNNELSVCESHCENRGSKGQTRHVGGVRSSTFQTMVKLSTTPASISFQSARTARLTKANNFHSIADDNDWRRMLPTVKQVDHVQCLAWRLLNHLFLIHLDS
jgi:hypothetical protein